MGKTSLPSRPTAQGERADDVVVVSKPRPSFSESTTTTTTTASRRPVLFFARDCVIVTSEGKRRFLRFSWTAGHHFLQNSKNLKKIICLERNYSQLSNFVLRLFLP